MTLNICFILTTPCNLHFVFSFANLQKYISCLPSKSKLNITSNALLQFYLHFCLTISKYLLQYMEQNIIKSAQTFAPIKMTYRTTVDIHKYFGATAYLQGNLFTLYYPCIVLPYLIQRNFHSTTKTRYRVVKRREKQFIKCFAPKHYPPQQCQILADEIKGTVTAVISSCY